MFFAHGREGINPYYNILGILQFENIFKLKISLFAYKIKNDKSNTPVVLLNILTSEQLQNTRPLICILPAAL